MKTHTPSESEKTFIDAYEGLRQDLWDGLIQARDWTYESWKPFWEVTRLLQRLYAGQEKIIAKKNTRTKYIRNYSIAE